MAAYQQIIETCSELIAERKLTIAFAESATAGKLAYAFSQTPFSGEVLKGALVCYNAYIKEEVLGITVAMIKQFTPESAEVTREMAVRIQQLMSADLAVAVTGLTTTGGSEQPGKPVGTMFYCVLYGREILERKKIFTGEPAEIIDLTIEQIAKTIIHLLEN
ncbi:CinA family protein [Taibaiella koreensis]|uniref:CinA family protein n=1 Tax=Taibaiella koreensis TaxID=1268548 RepID=UPI000E59E6EE|nr:CinA family protein [Taibaiella koreensis]